MLAILLVPSLNIETTSMEAAAVESVGVPPANLVEVNAPVLEPVLSCVMIIVTVPPVGRFEIVKVVLCASVTVCTLATAASTVIPVELVSAFMSSL